MYSRYIKNMNMLSQAEIKKLEQCKVCVIGCGGLGGYVIEMLGRLGVGNITAVDGDVFDETNLNRQLLSDTGVIGKSKAQTAKNRMLAVNPLINVIPVFQRLTPENGREILEGNDVVVDAVDNTDTRLLLQHWAAKLGIPMVHGAIAGWYGQVTTVLPGDGTLEFLYARNKSNGIEKELGNPSFTPALVASIQVSETLKLLIDRGALLRNKILFVDLLGQEYEVVSL